MRKSLREQNWKRGDVHGEAARRKVAPRGCKDFERKVHMRRSKRKSNSERKGPEEKKISTGKKRIERRKKEGKKERKERRMKERKKRSRHVVRATAARRKVALRGQSKRKERK